MKMPISCELLNGCHFTARKTLTDAKSHSPIGGIAATGEAVVICVPGVADGDSRDADGKDRGEPGDVERGIPFAVSGRAGGRAVRRKRIEDGRWRMVTGGKMPPATSHGAIANQLRAHHPIKPVFILARVRICEDERGTRRRIRRDRLPRGPVVRIRRCLDVGGFDSVALYGEGESISRRQRIRNQYRGRRHRVQCSRAIIKS